MEDNIKTLYNIQYNGGAEDIIENWAAESGFEENKTQRGLGYDDLTYCFSFAEGGAKTLLMINILDNNIHLEAWLINNINSNKSSAEAIGRLLKLLVPN